MFFLLVVLFLPQMIVRGLSSVLVQDFYYYIFEIGLSFDYAISNRLLHIQITIWTFHLSWSSGIEKYEGMTELRESLYIHNAHNHVAYYYVDRRSGQEPFIFTNISLFVKQPSENYT